MPRELSDTTRKQRKRGIIDLSKPEEYLPWLTCRECMHGSGRRHSIPDLKYPTRTIHLMSDLELSVYFMLRKNPKVQELFEQVPLELRLTQFICEELNIYHPSNPRTKKPIVMTTDFVAYVWENKALVPKAYAVKPFCELEDRRVYSKLLIEKRYWEQKGIEWAVITEKNLDNT